MSPNLRNYQQEVWNFISHFHYFDINIAPWIHNVAANTLVNVDARFSPLKDGFSIKIMYRPFVLDNITNFHVFNNNQQLLDFMVNTNVLKDVAIDEDEHEK